MHYFDSLQLPYSCRQIYDLVADIEHYPDFLPGWQEARILETRDNCLYAEQQLRTGPAVFRFHSTALLEPCSRIHITSDDGPFRKLAIDWRFDPGNQQDCNATIELTFSMRPGLMNSALSLLLETGSSQLLPLFGERARALYQQSG